METMGPGVPATFRDPAGTLRIEDGHVLRTVLPQYAQEALGFVRSALAERWVSEGRLVATEVLEAEPGQPLVLSHPRICFPSYPWEWTAGQWIRAADLTLDFCSELVKNGRILKDATPLNVLFEGTRPVFVDVLSPEVRDPSSPLWLAYGQFARTFLLPLAALKYLGWPLAATIRLRDGYEPRDLYPYLPWIKRWRGPLRSLVTVPRLLERGKSGGAQPARLQQPPEVAAAVLGRSLRRLRHSLLQLRPQERESRWSNYPAESAHYSTQDRGRKQNFVKNALSACSPRSVLDIGANTGEYSRIAAESGARVVAWDPDAGAAERNWLEAERRGLDILPVVADAARPTPAVGWRNSESLSLLERAKGRFDCLLLLGVVHHLLLHDQIPLPEIASLAAELSRRWVIAEWVPKNDPRFVDLCACRDELYSHLDEALFVATMAAHFAVVKRELLGNGRVLFLFEKQ